MNMEIILSQRPLIISIVFFKFSNKLGRSLLPLTTRNIKTSDFRSSMGAKSGCLWACGLCGYDMM